MGAENNEGHDYIFREPAMTNGAGLWRMARESRDLDLSAPSFSPMLADYFTDSCVVAEKERKPVGFVSAFLRPAAPEVIFIWQITVARGERGKGLGRKLLHHLLTRPACRGAGILEAAVSKSNPASRALFEALARDLQVPLQLGQDLESRLFPDGVHDSEDLVRIAPLPPRRQGFLPLAGLNGDEGYERALDQYAKPQPRHGDRARDHRRA